MGQQVFQTTLRNGYSLTVLETGEFEHGAPMLEVALQNAKAEPLAQSSRAFRAPRVLSAWCMAVAGAAPDEAEMIGHVCGHAMFDHDMDVAQAMADWSRSEASSAAMPSGTVSVMQGGTLRLAD